MRIAVWNLPPADLFSAGFSMDDSGGMFEVQRLGIPDCLRALLEGHVDAALVPTMSVLQHHEDLDVVPAVALSSWKYPFARLVIGHDLGTTVRTVAYNPDYEQERFLAELILREHYRMEPDFEAVSGVDVAGLRQTATDAHLLVGGDVAAASFEGRVLDIGQEWFELAAYPMTWGLFATRKDELDAPAIRALRDGVLASERRKKIWMRATETSKPLHTFYTNDLRFRLDDLCVAGLTEFRQFLYYYDLVDDVREIPFVFLPDDQSESSGDGDLI